MSGNGQQYFRTMGVETYSEDQCVDVVSLCKMCMTGDVNGLLALIGTTSVKKVRFSMFEHIQRRYVDIFLEENNDLDQWITIHLTSFNVYCMRILIIFDILEFDDNIQKWAYLCLND